MLLYLICRRLMRNRFPARLQYLLAKAAVLYYLIPLPFLKRWYDRMALQMIPRQQNKAVGISPEWSNYAVYANGNVHINVYMKTQIIVLAVWLLVALVLLSCGLVDYVKTRKRILLCMHRGMDKTRDQSVERLRQMYGLKSKIIVCQVGAEEKTMSFGFFSPVILCSQKISSREAEFALQHEMIHIKRGDIFWQLLKRMMILLHWWNPVAWLLYFHFEKVCEWSNDELLVQGRPKEEIKLYLRMLIAESKKEQGKAVNAAGWSVELSSVTKRVQERMENIMKLKKWSRITAGIVTTVLVCANSLTVLAYKDVTYEKVDVSVSAEQATETMETDLWMFTPDEAGTGKVGMVSLASEDPVEMLYEIQFVDENGNVYEIEDENCICSEENAGSAGLARSCNHDYVAGTVSKHWSKDDGSCIVKVYDAKRCYFCGLVVSGEQISETKYMKCPHK